MAQPIGAAGGGSMSPEDLEFCRKTHANLTSDTYRGINYLFLEPFDLSQVPGYMDVVSRRMDLSTLGKNLSSGMYATRNAFFADAKLIFENAIQYHSDRETKWIVKPAKEMLKLVQKEKKVADKKFEKKIDKKSDKKKTKKKDKPALKLKLGSATAGATAPAPAPTAVEPPPVVPAPAKPKIAIRLKGPKDSKQMPEKVKPAKKTAQPKFKLKLSLGGAGASGTQKKKSSPVAAEPKPTAEPDAVVTPKSSATPKSASSTAATTGSAKSSSTTTNKIQVRPAGPRGKELPKGVTAPTTKKKTTQKKSSKASGSKKKKLPTTTTPTAAAANSTTTKTVGLELTEARRAQCYKVLNGLRRRQQTHMTWFSQPVTHNTKDKQFLLEYRAKIKNPIDLSTMTSRLDKNQYATLADFCIDLRRIFANCLRFNTSIKESLRPVAVQVLATAEELLAYFISQPEPTKPVYPPLLYCWKLCISVLDTLYNLNETDGQQTALYFLHPVSFYFGGQFPPDYLEKVERPMDFGTVTANLLEGRYQTLDAFANDCRLILANCVKYYTGRPDGQSFTDQANRLGTVLTQQLDALYRYEKSPSGAQLKAASSNMAKGLVQLQPVPPVSLLLGIVNELRALKYTDKATKITEPAMKPFEKPVSLTVFPDYMQVIKTPMDLQTVEQKSISRAYATPEDFEYDVTLMFRNCEQYHSKRKTDQMVAMAKNGAKHFRKIFTARMKSFEEPSSVAEKDSRKHTSTPTSVQGAPKKIKISAGGVSKGKTGPRINIAAPVAEKKPPGRKSPKPSVSSRKLDKPNQPVPLHIAIMRVKEAFPLRRALKDLQPWEGDCARFFKELMKHQWISAARPKFIFHVPVPVLFPDLREAYAAKISKPMDLTTVECTLLAGNRYSGAEDFVNDVALVFANAITFNKDGRDLGDPLSCAYYNASIHLLRYTRWLSLEHLTDHIEDSEHVDEPGENGLPPVSWRLTTGNRAKAREEMKSIVLNEPIDKSLEGDRYTWMEAECEKLLKALRHQSDLRYMTYFIQSKFPPDYLSFISKPMDWETCQRTLKKRQYDKFGDVIDDLRLIFTNALKYNAPLKGTDTVSGQAYDAAKHMSAKLEVAINKGMVTISDRLERERIDHANAEREIEAADRAEEEKIRAQWKTEADKSGTTAPMQVESVQKVRAVRRVGRRETDFDFEVPFFGEDDGGHQHERSYMEVVKQQKATFERQRQDLARMHRAAVVLGVNVFARMSQRQLAVKWLEGIKDGVKANKEKSKSPTKEATVVGQERPDGVSGVAASSVKTELEKEGRSPLKMKLLPAKKKVQTKPRPLLEF